MKLKSLFLSFPASSVVQRGSVKKQYEPFVMSDEETQNVKKQDKGSKDFKVNDVIAFFDEDDIEYRGVVFKLRQSGLCVITGEIDDDEEIPFQFHDNAYIDDPRDIIYNPRLISEGAGVMYDKEMWWEDANEEARKFFGRT